MVSSRIAASLGMLILAGCAGGQGDPLAPAGDPAGTWQGSFTGTAPGIVEGIPGGWTITIDPATMSATAEPWRSGETIQGKLFDLDTYRFFRADQFRIGGIRFDPDGNLLLDYQIIHPFGAPDFSKPISAANRADLGFTGRLLFLTDVPADQVADRTFFSSTVVANTDVVLNANHYVRPGDLLVSNIAGFNANAFPCRLVVDEALNGGQGNRAGISNGSDPRGNYDPSGGGWARLNIGVSRDRWTGYDFLHQGQRAINTVAISKDAIAVGALTTIDVALLIKYTDPRGVPFPQNPQVRMPQDPADTAVFAYRMPNGALDASDISFQGLPNRTVKLGAPIDTELPLTILVRDWDARAPETTETVLANDPDISKVNIGTSGAPVVAVSCPAISATTFSFTAGGQNGRPGSEIAYSGTLINRLGTAPRGSRQAALVRATDPEQGASGRNTYHFGVDPDTLAGDPARAVRVITYQALAIEVVDLAPTFEWGGAVGGEFADASRGVAVDALGNAYISGRFLDNVDFDPGSGTQFRSGFGADDCFLLALDPDGVFRWVATWGGTSFDDAAQVVLAPDGNLYLTGYFQATVDFDPGPGTVLRTATGLQDGYLLSLTPAGAYRFVRTWGGDLGAVGTDLSADALGNLFIGGFFTGTIDFDPGAGTQDRTAVGSQDSFLLSLTPDGDYRWVADWGGPNAVVTERVSVDPAGPVQAGGSFLVSADLDPGPGTELRTSNGQRDAFVLSLTADGDYRWGHSFGGTGFEFLWGLATSSNGTSHMAGSFQDTVDFDPGAGTVNRTSGGFSDAFLLTVNSSGDFQWVATWGGSQDCHARDVALSADGRLYLTGDFNLTADFDPGPATLLRTSSTLNYSDGYILVLASTGAFRWVETLPATEGIRARRIQPKPAGSSVLVGEFSGTIDLDPGPGTVLRSSNGFSDAFVTRFSDP